MIHQLSGPKLYLSSIALSLSYLIGFEPFGYQFIGLLAVSALFYFAINLNEKRAALLFFLFGFFLYCTGLYWLYISIHIVSGAPKILAVLLIGILSIYLSFIMDITGNIQRLLLNWFSMVQFRLYGKW